MCFPAIPSWKAVTAESLSFGRLLGMSNLILYVAVTDPVLLAQGLHPSKVLLRIYPLKLGRIVNKQKEQAVFSHLAETDHGVKMYYQCPQYRLEEFIEGEKLTFMELNNKILMKAIAQIFCEYNHDAALSDIVSQFDPKTPFADRFFVDWYATFKSNFPSYLEKVKTEENLAILKRLQYLTTPEFEKEYKMLVQGLSGSEMVVAHSDVHEMNMLKLLSSKDKVLLIDYEYTTFNYRAIDIATLWVETTIDYTYPVFPFVKQYEANKWDEEDLIKFIRAYLERDAILKGRESVEEYVNKELPSLLLEVKKAEPLVSVVWAVWSIIMIDWKEVDETKDWNFAYAALRFGQFEKSKKDALKLV